MTDPERPHMTDPQRAYLEWIQARCSHIPFGGIHIMREVAAAQVDEVIGGPFSLAGQRGLRCRVVSSAARTNRIHLSQAAELSNKWGQLH